jgi:dCMP deaminase
MLIIFEAPDKNGKTTLALKLSEFLNIPYLKLNNISIKTDESINDSVSIATHSQLETTTQLYEKGVIKHAILDRFHGSEFVYSNLFKRPYNLLYLGNIEERLSKFNDVIIIRTQCSYVNNKKRFKEEKLLDVENLEDIREYYNDFFNNTNLPVIEIDTNNSIELAFAELLSKLNNRGIFPDHLRERRATHEESMIDCVKAIARRSPCLTRRVGAIITEDGFIVGVGYNGPPSGLSHDTTDLRKEKGFKSGEGLDYSRDVHAEQNAIMQSGLRAKRGGNLELFTTSSPCIHCMRMLIQIGIKRIVYIEKYDNKLAWEMADEAGIEMVQYKE